MALAKHSSLVSTSRPQTVALAAADLAWEQVQEAGVRSFRAGRGEAAMRHFGRGSAIARQHFAHVDPRLATSLTNAAFASRQRGDVAVARRHFAEASCVFAAGAGWIWRMKRANGSGPTYEAAALNSFQGLLRETAAMSHRIDWAEQLPVGLLERWHLERPLRASDLRKLLGAALLMVSRAGA